MCNSAAHAVDRVLPAVPVRQYVLSLPFELRRAAAFRADVATALGRIFMEAVACEQKRTAGLVQSQSAAMNHIQRFGGSLNLNLHFHAVVADGVFVPDDAGRVSFHETGAPSREALDRIVRRVRDRTLRWLRKKGLLEERPPEDRSNEAPERSALDACADIALRGGTFARLERAEAAQTGEAAEARFDGKHPGPMTAELDGFNVQAAVRIEAGDDEGRERLVRYCARPCFALERLSVLPDGRVAYRVKYAGRGGTHRVMTKVEFLARLAALVAPPRYPLVRYHGVLAPHSKWRSAVVPRPPIAHAHENPVLSPRRAGAKGHTPASTETPPARKPHPPPRVPVQHGGGSQANTATQMAAPPPKVPPTASMSPPPKAIAAERRGAATQRRNHAADLACAELEITDFGISVRHLDRLLGGLLLVTAPRVDWAKLPHRTYAASVLRCGRCGGGRLRMLATRPANCSRT